MFLFQSILKNTSFKQWQIILSRFVWHSKKSRVKYKILQDAKDRKHQDCSILNCTLYSYLIWMKGWVLLRKKKNEMKGHDLRFVCCRFLLQHNINVDFNYVKNNVLRIWNKYEHQLGLKIHLLTLAKKHSIEHKQPIWRNS